MAGLGDHFNVRTVTGLTPLAEKQMLKAIAQDLNVFFTQIRVSGLVERLSYMLHTFAQPLPLSHHEMQSAGAAAGAAASSSSTATEPQPPAVEPRESQIGPAEQFLFLCWTRHSNIVVQELMDATDEFLDSKKYNEALAALGEIIKVDPSFAEAYTRRATVYFGLKRAEECFADIACVLRIEPAHYCALCGEGFMMMKLGRYEEAIRSFERAIKINPSLSRGSLGKQLQQCKDVVVATAGIGGSGAAGGGER